MNQKASLLGTVMLLLCSCAASAGPVRTGRADGVLTLENGQARLVLREPNYTLEKITNLETGCEYVAEPGEGIFRLTMMKPGEAPDQWYNLPAGTLFHAGAFGRKSAEPFGDGSSGGWILKYSAAAWGKGDILVTIRITLEEDSPLFQWDISIDNRSDEAIQHLEFPYLGGLGAAGAEATEFMAVPIYSGRKQTNLRKHFAGLLGYTEYPAGGMTVQLMTYDNGRGDALYFASHDGQNFKKTFVARPTGTQKAFNETVIHYPDMPYRRATWELQYPVVAGPISGDWYDACKIYRSWALTQERWSKSLAERGEIPAWVPETPVWFQGNEWTFTEEALLAFADRIVAVREALGYPMAFHWYIWQQYGKHDYMYPDYLPARPGFAEAVRKVQAAGVKVIPYLNIQLCETRLPIWGELELARAAKRDYAGELYRCYGVCDDRSKKGDASKPVDVFRGETAGRDMVPMCPSEPAWQEVILAQARGLAEDYKVDAIYWDETFCYPGLCYASDHTHPWIGGPAHADGVAEIHRRSVALREGLVTAGENLGESYTDVCPLLINAHSDGQGDSLPIFQTVHSDHVAEVGLFVKGGEFSDPEVFFSKLAFSLLRGRILGWFNSDHGLLGIVKPEYEEQLKMLRHFCDVRLAGLPWLYSGEMLRKPDMSALPSVVRTWSPWDSSGNQDFTFPAVDAACYLSADGRIGIILVNLTGEKQQAVFPWNFRDWGGAPGMKLSRSEYRDGAWSTPAEFTLSDTVTAEMPPHQAVILAFGAGE